MNTEQTILVKRLKEAGLHTRRFNKVNAEKKAFEKEWQRNPYEPSELDAEGYERWGIIGRTGLVPIDTDNEKMAEIIRQIFLPTFETISPRRKLPHFYFAVTDGEVPNSTLFLKGDDKGSGEIRSQNEYLVAPGTEIQYKDIKTSEEKNGRYTILHDRPIAKVEYAFFMEAVKPYLGSTPGQKITFKQMREGVPSGSRHAQGIKFATFLIGVKRFDEATALHAMRDWNLLCRPPMGDDDLQRMVRNAMGYVEKKAADDMATSEMEGRDIYSEFIDIFEITVKEDRRILEFILPTGMSTYIGDPDNLGLEAPTSEGKTYPTLEVLKHFPKEDVWLIGGLSPTALAHDKGILVGDDNQSIENIIHDLNKEKRKAKKEKDEEHVEDIENELRELYKKSKYLIDMSNKIIVFLEAPQRDTFARLRPILSHDTPEITYKFTDKGGRGQLRTNTVVVRGWPAVIYMKAGKGKEDDIWPEIQSRFSTISPKMNTDKYREAIKLTAMREGLPETVFNQKLKLDVGGEEVKKWIVVIKQRLMEIVEAAREATGKHAPNIFWMPFYSRIGDGFPASIGRHMRDSKRFIRAMKMSAAINVFNRPIVKIGGEESIMVVGEDYHRAVRLFFEDGEELFSGIPGHVIAVFKDVILPEWDNQFTRLENEEKQQTFTEDERINIGNLTSAGIAEAYKRTYRETRKTLSANTLNRYYLRVLEDAGLMSKEPDPENKKQYTWKVLRRDIVPEDWRTWAQMGDAPEFPLEMLKEGIKELEGIGARKPLFYKNKVQLLEVEEIYNQYFKLCKPDSHAPIELSTKKGEKPEQAPNNRRKNKMRPNALIKSESSPTKDITKPEKTEEKIVPRATKRTVSDVERKIVEAFGINPFKESQVEKLFPDKAEQEKAWKVLDDMRERGKAILIILESGEKSWRSVN